MPTQAEADAYYQAWLAAVRAIRRFEIEVWVLLAVSMTLIVARLVAQMRAFGWNRLQADDYLVVMAGGCFIAECVSVVQIDRAGGTSFKMTDAQRLALTAEQVSMYSLGQKWYLVGLSCYISTLWLLKGAMLFLLKRVTRGLKQEKLIAVSFVLVGVSWVGLQLSLFLTCQPFDNFFQVLLQPSGQCQGTSAEYYIPTLALNVLSDILIMAIPIPLLWQIQISAGKKAMLTCLLCGGIFIIIASILRTTMSLISLAQTFDTFAWSIREILVAMIVTNAAVIKPMFNTKTFETKTSYGYGTGYGNGYGRRSPDLEDKVAFSESTVTLPTKAFPSRNTSLSHAHGVLPPLPLRYTPGIAY